MSKTILSFEVNEDDELVELHLNENGLRDLLTALEKAKEHKDHQHLMTEDWGGNVLSSETLGQGNKKVHHVKVLFWE